MENKTYRKIESYLYNYNRIDLKLHSLQSEICDSEYNQNYTRWIKNKSSSLEDQVIKNINLEKRIYKITKWKHLISEVLQKYKKTNNLKYKFINLKYFCKASPLSIEKKLNLSLKEQKDIQAEILQYIFFVAIKNEMLKEVYF